ncbi:MAG: SGNH/GDSL hydrolase family protein [Akkermansiaceae bacterium]
MNIHRAPANCGATTQGVKKLKQWLGTGKWDVIHFNFGIHDRNLPLDTYAGNLEQIVSVLETTGAKLIWARTTPPASVENAEKFSPEQCERLNRIADEIMKQHGIPTTDLCTPIQPRLSELQNENNVHFNAFGYKVLAQQVAVAIVARLNDPKK